MYFGVEIELSELPKASSLRLDGVVVCLHGSLNADDLSVVLGTQPHD